MIFVILAALSGLVWGVGDFAGGKGTQRVAALTVAVLSKLASLPLLALYLVLLHDPLRPEVLGWGAVAGVFGMAGLVIFYRALASGAMAVVAPVSAVTAAVLPMVVGLAMGERPGALPLTGAGCAIVAIALVSAAPGGTHRAVVTGRLIVMSLLAGGGFGTFFVFMQRAGAAAAGAGAGLWPVLAAQVASLALGAILLWRRGAGRRHDGVGRCPRVRPGAGSSSPVRWTCRRTRSTCSPCRVAT